MKKVVISFIGFVTFLTACVLFSSCEKTCMQWSCNTHKVDKNTTVNDNTVDLSELNNVDLSELDSVDCVVWWEIQNDTLKVWTEEDERRADIERFNYIRSLDTTGWE